MAPAYAGEKVRGVLVRMAKIKLGPSIADKRARRAEERAHDFAPREPILHLRPGEKLLHPVATLDEDADYKLPPFRRLRAQLIRPRQLVDVVVDMDFAKDLIDVRRSVIEDIDPQGRVLLAQTSPPVLRSMRGRQVEVTFLTFVDDVPGGRWIRVGYRTKIQDVVPQYDLGGDYQETVIVIGPPRKFVPSTTRLANRVEPTGDMDLKVALPSMGRGVTMLDISGTGISFIHPAEMVFHAGAPIRMVVLSGPAALPLNGVVVRSRPTDNRRVLVTAVRFEDLKPEDKRRLLQLVTEMHRHHLAMRSGFDD